MHSARQRGTSVEIKQAKFVRSVVKPPVQGLAPLPEIALVGRSNVGKSSLINSLCNQSKLARVSATPGKTRMVNYFAINEAFYLVDLPGYGYAQVSQKEKQAWGQMVEGYLSTAQALKHLFLLLDVRREPSVEDQQMAYWLQHYDIPCTILATKCDKLSRSARHLAARELSTKVGMTFQTPTILYSTTERLGRKELLQRIGDVLAGTAKEYEET